MNENDGNGGGEVDVFIFSADVDEEGRCERRGAAGKTKGGGDSREEAGSLIWGLR